MYNGSKDIIVIFVQERHSYQLRVIDTLEKAEQIIHEEAGFIS